MVQALAGVVGMSEDDTRCAAVASWSAQARNRRLSTH